MTTTTLAFGNGVLAVELPERTRVVRPTPAGAGLSPLPDQEAAVRAAIAQPLGMPLIGELVRPDSRVLIAFDDPTVTYAGPLRRQAIEAVLAELAGAGVAETNVTLICANALHRKWTRQELGAIIGPELVARFGARLICHDAEDRDNLVYLGATTNGYDVEVHRLVMESDLTVYVNAGVNLGFSGGWKSVVVGLSTWRSIRWTHTPDGMSMSVRNNRMHTVLDEMGVLLEQRLGRRIFKVETLLANPREVAHVWAGTVAATRTELLAVQAANNPPRRDAAAAPVDVVVYGVANTSPYTAFARSNPILTLISSGLGYQGGYIEALGKPGCSVVMATPCPEEWDMEHHPAYREAWDRVLPATTDAYEIHHRFTDEFAGHAGYIDRYRNGVAFHPVHAILATQPLKRLRHAGRIYVAGAEDPAVPRHAGFTPARSVEEAIAAAGRQHGPDCTIAAIAAPEAQHDTRPTTPLP